MLALGLESTAHTFGVGIIRDKKILANVKDSYTTEKGGIIPIEAAKHHENVYKDVIEKALKQAKVKLKDLDLVSYSCGPGLAPCLRVGLEVAKEIAEKYGIPLIPCNHCISHLTCGELATGSKNPVFLYVSGANTQVIAFEGGKYRIFGETLDQGVGNFLDAFARYTGLGFPGGPKLYELSLKSNNLIELPYVVKGMDISVSGLLTNLKQKYDSKKYKIEDLAYSVQETVFAMLLEVAERAMAHCQKKELLLGGGVACNKRLQEMAKRMCGERNAKCFIPPNELMLDNGAMICWQGILEQKNAISIDKADIKPYERTDDVIVNW
ncbi:MAG: tRNA (adenosine(37)-N6)-threonylcarbamoyltransferase complex transferase subunit TsaD [Nanoarchaeota archaeon]|nr:tRNA (adenosine(37)-N6)-threonylcarbamoyltransferase complex transferase subunit TsaD [Nanoarchaeota archaeon]